MADGKTVDVHFLLSQSDIAASFLKYLPAGELITKYLPAGELITLARTNSAIRADLHGFGEPHLQTAAPTNGVRSELQIGHHETARWKKLKADAAYECSSRTHTKGTDVKPCRYCSKLICGACMTRDSFKNPGEKTFQNRCRSFCESCWTSGNRHRRQKINDGFHCHGALEKGLGAESQEAAEATKTCECTNRNDGWVCLDCKNLQNRIWISVNCFGEGCANSLDSAAERRKICMWCDKPLPITATRENPHIYKQKVVDAMAKEAASRQADAEEYAVRRQKRLRMTRRELRGDEEVFDDIPQYVRHLDTVNYTKLLGHGCVPTSDQVYDSKQGRWQYSLGFLLAFRMRCDAVQVPSSVKETTKNPNNPIERTNRELFEREESSRRKEQEGVSTDDGGYDQYYRRWDRHQGQIMRMRYIEDRSARYIQDTIYKDHGLWESEEHYKRLTAKWKRDVELVSSRTRIPNQDRSRYWRDIGSSSTTTQDVIDAFTGGLKDGSGAQPRLLLLDETSPLQSWNKEVAPRILTALDTTPTPKTTGTEEFATSNPKTRDASNKDEMEVDTPESHLTARDIPQILKDLEARQSALKSREPSNDEEEEQLLAEQAALQMEWEEALLIAQDAGDDVDSDDVNMLIAMQESLNEAQEPARNERRPDGRPPVYFE